MLGNCYVNENRGTAREVLKVDHHTVRYNTYELASGRLLGAPHECSREEFIRWADREATEDEMFRLLYEEMEALFTRARQHLNPENSLTIETAALLTRTHLINR
jgi:hypothetical protein